MKFRLDCRLPFPADLFWSIRATPGFMNFVVEDGLLKAMTGTASTSAPDPRALDGVLPAAGGSPAPVTAAGEQPRRDIRTRQQTYTPARVEMPDLVRGIVGQTLFEVTDSQTWDASPDAPTVQAFRITPSFLSSLCTTSGVLSVQPAAPLPGGDTSGGDGGGDSPATPAGVPAVPTVGGTPISWCTHVVDGTARVRLVGVGVWVERAMLHNLRLFYADYPATVDRFRGWLLRRHGRPGDGGGDAALARAVWRFRVAEGGEFAPLSRPVVSRRRRRQPAAGATEGASSEAEGASALGSDGDVSSREEAGSWSEYHSVATDHSDYASAVEVVVDHSPVASAVAAAAVGVAGWTSEGNSTSDSDSDSDSPVAVGVPPCRCGAMANVAIPRGETSRRAQARGAGPPRRRRSLTPLSGSASDADIDDAAGITSMRISGGSSCGGTGSESDIGSAATAGSARSGGSGRLRPRVVRRHHRKTATAADTAVPLPPSSSGSYRRHRRRRRAFAASAVSAGSSLSPARSALSIGVEELMGRDAPPPSPPPPSLPPSPPPPPLSASAALPPTAVRPMGVRLGSGGGVMVARGGPAARACRVAMAIAVVSAVAVLAARAGGRGDGWASDDGSEDGW
ncbi:hypothetical protein MMPV_004602 [Pyropia vietnamensis]